jgi:hypothetical protein
VLSWAESAKAREQTAAVTNDDARDARLLTPAQNFAVVQMPGRQYPGVVFQGDSLSTFCELARSLAVLTADTPAGEEAADLSERLDSILRSYLAVLKNEGIAPPFDYRPPPLEP